jgi:hypothetical protein
MTVSSLLLDPCFFPWKHMGEIGSQSSRCSLQPHQIQPSPASFSCPSDVDLFVEEQQHRPLPRG